MSLQARIEAVIYAAEEPVTLAQLSAVFGHEALAEREARLRDQASSQEEATSRELFPGEQPLTAERAADEHAGEPASDAAIEQAVVHPEQVAASQADGFAAQMEEPAVPAGNAAASGSARATDAAAEAMLEEKRLARIREREARDEIRRVIDELIASYDRDQRGMEIREIAGGYRVATRPEYHDAVRSFVKSLKPPIKLTLQALETLAVIAYKQPVTAPEVSEIRGVDSGGVLGSLISRKLVTTAGRKQVIGRPILYKTTKEFLLCFGLKDLAELPSMEEFEKMAGELADAEAPASQMDLPEPEIDQRGQVMVQAEPADAEDVQAAPEQAEALEGEELVARAQAAVRIDDESSEIIDLPGVHRDTAGVFGAGSVKQSSPSEEEKDEQ